MVTAPRKSPPRRALVEAVRRQSLCKASVRSSIGGRFEKSLPTLELIPKTYRPLESSLAPSPSRRSRTWIMVGLFISSSEPLSSRNLRWREKPATLMPV